MINQHHNKQMISVSFLFCFCIILLYPRWARQYNKARCACVAVCVRCGVIWLAQALTLIKDTSSRQSLLDRMNSCGSSWCQDNTAPCLIDVIYMWMIMTWPVRTVETWRAYLLVGWQCDIQIAYGSLWKALSGFWLSQEGEAATWLLAHVSDL